MWALALGGCLLGPVEEEPLAPLSISALWAADLSLGTRVTIGPVLVTSGRTVDQRVFFVSDPEGGPESGAMIALGAILDDWPPEVGAEVQLTGSLLRKSPGPILELLTDSDGVVLGHRDGPAAALWSEDPLEQAALTYGLVTAPDLTVTSRPDPLGEADTDGSVAVGGRFGIAPGYGQTGDLLGIVEEGRISARTASDWSGALESDPPIAATIEQLLALPEGAPVLLDDLLLATPWSRDARWAVAQDAAGRGIWLDGEAWGMPALAQTGEVGLWTGEVRHRDEGLVIRVWEGPVFRGVRAVRATEALDDGSIATIDITTLSAPNLYGERIANGAFLLDDRFIDISALSAPVTATGAARLLPDGTVLFAPFAL